MGGTTSCFTPAAADFKKSVKRGDGETALRALVSHPQLLSRPTSLCSTKAVTPLHAACENKQTLVVEDILAFLALSSLATVQAALQSYCRRTGTQLPCTVEEGVRLAVDMTNAKGQTPLMYACCSDAPELVQLLMSKGADPWVRDRSDGRTALHYAAMARSADALRALLQGIPPHLITRQGCRYVDAPSSCGLTALHYCAHSGCLAALRELLYDHQPHVNAATTSESFDERCVLEAGSTPLHFAAVQGNLAAAVELLRYYSQRVVEEPSLEDPRTCVDALGQTPWQVLTIVHPADLALAALLRPGQPLHQALRSGLAAGGLKLSLGPPSLAALAAEVLRAKLLSEVRAAAARAGPPAAVKPQSRCSREAPEEVRFLRVSSLVLPPPPPRGNTTQSDKRASGSGGPDSPRPCPGVAGGSPKAQGPRNRIDPSPGPVDPGCCRAKCNTALASVPATGAPVEAATGAPVEAVNGVNSAAITREAESDGSRCAADTTSRAGVQGGSSGEGSCSSMGCEGDGSLRNAGGCSGGRRRSCCSSSGFGGPSGFHPIRNSEWDDDADEPDGGVLCEVCFEAPVVVAPAACGHGVCVGCAERLCAGLGAGKPLSCPFCRRSVAAYVAWVPRFKTQSLAIS